ncbi:acyl-CoA dehydrogenase [Lentibacillus halophilus]|uniref:Acyl-CoA dehydrogenase n=1 Tax=Lentibacillus halophilus TaxID=295065 RepID=A0ABN0Z6W7_9BACI
MNFRLTDEQERIRGVMRDFAQTDVSPLVERMEQEGRFPSELVKKMGNIGLMGIPIPTAYGGSGMDYISYISAIIELSKVSAALGVILSVHTSVGTNPIVRFGTEQQKSHYLPKLASGTYLGAFALTESEAGSDAASMRTIAVLDGDDYVLNGEKMFTTNGREADTFITFARTSGEGRSKGISAFIVEKDAPGLFIGKSERKMGLHGSSTVQVGFDHCRISRDQLLGAEGDGFNIAMANLNVGRIGIAAQALGIAEAALEHTSAYARDRASSQLAETAAEVEAANLLTHQAASFVQRGVPCNKEASMAKVYAAKTARKAATEALRVCGRYACTEDSPVERFFRDAKVTEIYEGTNEIQHKVIAKNVLH